jgi:hypothetical protein
MSFQHEIDRAILDLYRGRGAFTMADLREALKVPAESPEAKRIANRVYRLEKSIGVLRTEGNYKRNRLYMLNKTKEAWFARRLDSIQPTASNVRLQAVPEGAPIRRLAGLAGLDDLKSTVKDLAAKVIRIETMVTELHAALFSEPAKPTQVGAEKS